MLWAANLVLLLLSFRPAQAVNYGVARTDAECRADHEAFDSLYLSGKREPAFSTGPPEECDTQGCLDGFWGPRARFHEEPTCPKELVKDLTAWLRNLSAQGSQWAKDSLVLQPCDFWPYLQGRTVWVIGDSVTENVGTALTTFLIEYWDKEHWEVTLTTDDSILAALNHGASEGVHGGGKRVSFWCYEMGTPDDRARLCYLKADRAKRSMHVLNVLPKISQPQDILLTNIGIHYNDMEDLEEDMTMLGFALGNPGLPQHKIWVETPPQHYETPTGMFNMSRPVKEQLCFPAGHFQGTNISVFADRSLGVAAGAAQPQAGSHLDVSLQRLLAGGDRNLATQPIVDALGLPTLRLWNTTLPLHQFHTHAHMPGEAGECSAEVACDCTHVCYPSAPQIAMSQLLHVLKRIGPKSHAVDQ